MSKHMSVKAMTITSAAIWGGSLLAVGLISMRRREYGREFLRAVTSVYPGANDSRTLDNVLVRTAYGVLDGAVAGALFAVLYNRLAD